MASLLNCFFQPKSEENIFNHPLYREVARFIMQNEYKYKHNPKLSPPRPIRIFGRSDMTLLLQMAKKDAAKNGIHQQPEIFCCFGFLEDGQPLVTDLWEVKQLLISGASGFGKTKALQSLLFSILWGNEAKNLTIQIFDIKRELNIFAPICSVIKHHESFMQQIDDIIAKMKKIYKELESTGLSNIEELNQIRRKNQQQPIKYTIVVVDEYASTASKVDEFDKKIELLSCLGRAAGILLILSTQRADHISLSSRIKANITSSLSFAQRDETNAKVAGVAGSEKLREKGKAIFNAMGDSRVVKSAFLETPKLKDYIDNLKRYNNS